MLDAGCWMLDAGYWILDTGYWIGDKFVVRSSYFVLRTSYFSITSFRKPHKLITNRRFPYQKRSYFYLLYLINKTLTI